MPFERQRLPLKAIGQIVTGKTPPTEVEGNFGGEIPFLTPSDFEEGRRSVTTDRTLSTQGLSKVKSCLVPYGVAVSCIGWQMGKSVIVKHPTVTNQQINTIVPDLRKVDTEFLYYYLVSLRRYIFELGATSTRTPIVNKGTFGDIEIELPPIDEQRRIAESLSILDQRIENLREINSTLESIAQAIFKSWFIDFDPVQAKAEGREPEGMDSGTAALFPSEFEESELGPIPKGWLISTLVEHVEAERGLSYKGAGLCARDEGVPMHNLNSVYEGGGYKYEGIKYYRGDYKERHIAVAGDIIVANTEQGHEHRLIGFPAIVPGRYSQGLYSHHIYRVRLRPGSSLTSHTLYYLLMAPTIREQIIGCANGSTVNMLKAAGLEIPRFVCPPRLVAQAFQNIVAPVRAAIEANVDRATTLTALRDLLLPRLVTGQLRVPDARRIVEEATV